MTLDVKIGRRVTIKLDGEQIINVRECPITYHDVCKLEYTLWPRESFRSGSSGFWEFWKNCVGTLYYQMRKHHSSNDLDIAFLKPLLEDINKLADNCRGEIDKDRMKWFKFWANRAVRLYGDDACIAFR